MRRLWTKKATWIARFHPDDTRKMHVADLLSQVYPKEGGYRTQGRGEEHRRE